jgi:hypothetical protein
METEIEKKNKEMRKCPGKTGLLFLGKIQYN